MIITLRNCASSILIVQIELRKKMEEYSKRFNPYWGELFKAGRQDSRFGKQVMDYACLYTSRASNLGESNLFALFSLFFYGGMI